VTLTVDVEDRGEEDTPDPLVFLEFPAAAHEATRRQWRWRVEQRAATVPAVLEGFPALL